MPTTKTPTKLLYHHNIIINCLLYFVTLYQKQDTNDCRLEINNNNTVNKSINIEHRVTTIITVLLRSFYYGRLSVLWKRTQDSDTVFTPALVHISLFS